MRRRSWIRLILIVLAVLLAASWGVSGALEFGWARRTLLARLSSSFGRPVEAGNLSFSLLRGPRLQVDSITVDEDPFFGSEYFLRADRLTASLRWSALLRGRVEFGTISFSHPSLNLVHRPDGHWNVESWLPAANAAARSANVVTSPLASNPTAAQTLSRIEIEEGRINFKLGQVKQLFALADVTGHLDQSDAGHWSIDLEADPMRASVALQDAGTLRLRGVIAGTSARLRPASLQLNWDAASLADVLRLATGQDYGARGGLSGEMVASIKDDGSAPGASNQPAPGEWKVAGTLRLAQVHRWDMPSHPEDPAVNLSVATTWQPGSTHLDVAHILMESAHSQIRGAGAIDWSRGFVPSVQILSSRISFADLLGWPRAFWPELPASLSLDGDLSLTARAEGWPLHLQQVSLNSTGAVVGLSNLSEPVRVGPASAVMQRDLLVLQPVSITLPGAPAAVAARSRPPAMPEAVPNAGGQLTVQGSLGPFRSGIEARDLFYKIGVTGQTTRAQDLIAVAKAFGRPTASDWTVTGPIALKLAWTGVSRREASTPKVPAPAAITGTIDLRGLQFTSVLLNQPMIFSMASIELKPDGRHVKLGDLQAFGGNWKGTLDRRNGQTEWQFDLTADRLDADDLDRWLGPRARPGFLTRMLPFASSAPPSHEAVVSALLARGRLRVGQVALEPFRIEKLDSAVELSGHGLKLQHAQAVLFGGRVEGDFNAVLSSDPAYNFRGQFDRVSLAALTSSAKSEEGPPPAGPVAGLASGDVILAAHGIGKDRLLGSLTGRGALRVREAILRNLNLAPVVLASTEAKFSIEQGLSPASQTLLTSSTAAAAAGESRFTSATADFHFLNGRLLVDQLSLVGRGEQHFEIQGSVDLSRKLDLHVWTLPRGVEATPDSEAGPQQNDWAIGGTLEAPVVTRQTHLAGNDTSVPGPAAARR